MTTSATDALARLKDGNRRFVGSSSTYRFAADERAAVAGGQQPWAVIVGCSDSRVPVEAVFDVGVGELFVVRTAGHVLAEASLASVRFAAEKLGSKLIVVLGHEDCGAVEAALSGEAPAWLEPIVSHIDINEVSAEDAPDDADHALLAAAVDEHVRDTVTLLRAFVRKFELDEPPLVVGGAYKLQTGEVHWLDDAE